MSTRLVVGGIAALGAAIAIGAAAATPTPELRSATVRQGHVVVTFTLGEDEAPGRIVVAVASTRGPHGGFAPGNVRLDEALHAKPYGDGYRAVTRRALRPGRYDV